MAPCDHENGFQSMLALRDFDFVSDDLDPVYPSLDELSCSSFIHYSNDDDKSEVAAWNNPMAKSRFLATNRHGDASMEDLNLYQRPIGEDDCWSTMTTHSALINSTAVSASGSFFGSQPPSPEIPSVIYTVKNQRDFRERNQRVFNSESPFRVPLPSQCHENGLLGSNEQNSVFEYADRFAPTRRSRLALHEQHPEPEYRHHVHRYDQQQALPCASNLWIQAKETVISMTMTTQESRPQSLVSKDDVWKLRPQRQLKVPRRSITPQCSSGRDSTISKDATSSVVEAFSCSSSSVSSLGEVYCQLIRKQYLTPRDFNSGNHFTQQGSLLHRYLCSLAGRKQSSRRGSTQTKLRSTTMAAPVMVRAILQRDFAAAKRPSIVWTRKRRVTRTGLRVGCARSFFTESTPRFDPHHTTQAQARVETRMILAPYCYPLNLALSEAASFGTKTLGLKNSSAVNHEDHPRTVFLAIIEILLQAAPEVLVLPDGREQVNTLHILLRNWQDLTAVLGNVHEMCLQVLRQQPLSVYVADRKGNTVLHTACASGVPLATVQELYHRYPASLSILNRDGRTPLDVLPATNRGGVDHISAFLRQQQP